jgi:chromosome transmission fidelity protein 4
LVADNSKIVLLEGHTCAVKSVSYDPTGNYIVSSDINGNIRIWDVSPNVPAPKCIKVLAAYSYRSDIDSLSKAKVAWHPDGTCFAFPGINNDIRVFRSGTWMPFYSLENQHTLNVSTLAWSPNGYYLASVSEDHSIAIWNTKTKSTVRFESSVSLITDLSWNPTLNEIALVCSG